MQGTKVTLYFLYVHIHEKSFSAEAIENMNRSSLQQIIPLCLWFESPDIDLKWQNHVHFLII